MHIPFKKAPVVHSPPSVRSSGQVYTDAVCVSPRSGTPFNTPVLIDNEHSCDSDDLTSENTPGIGSEAARMFNSYVKKGNEKEKESKHYSNSQFRKRSTSHRPHHNKGDTRRVDRRTERSSSPRHPSRSRSSDERRDEKWTVVSATSQAASEELST